MFAYISGLIALATCAIQQVMVCFVPPGTGNTQKTFKSLKSLDWKGRYQKIFVLESVAQIVKKSDIIWTNIYK